MAPEINRMVTEFPHEITWTVSSSGELDVADLTWGEYTGLGDEQSAGIRWQSAVHQGDLQKIRNVWRTPGEKGHPTTVSARIRRRDGVYRTFQLQISPVAEEAVQRDLWCVTGTESVDEMPSCNDALSNDPGYYRSIIDGLPALISLRTAAGDLYYANRRYLDYFDAEPDDVGAGGSGFHPDDRERAISSFKTSIATGSDWEIEARKRRLDGSYRWFLIQGHPLRDNHGNILLWYVTHVDIDDRKCTEALLAGEKHLLEMVAQGESMPAILDGLCRFVETTASGCLCSLILADQEGCRFEYGSGPSLPDGFVEAIISRPLDVESGPCAMATCLNEQIIASDLNLDDRWSTYAWCPRALSLGIQACWSTPIRSAAGHALGALAVYFDEPRSPTPSQRALIEKFARIASIAIERQRAQEALAQALHQVQGSEDRLRADINAIPGFVWSTSPEGGVDFLNQRWLEYTGMSMEESYGEGWRVCLHPDDAVDMAAYWQTLLASGEAGDYEARLRGVDGLYRWFLIRAVPLRDQTGRVVRWYGQNTDIEDRKRVEMLQSREKYVLKMMAGDEPLPAILDSLCRLVESSLDGCVCSVLLIDPRPIYGQAGADRAIRFQQGASPGLPPILTDNIDGSAVDMDAFPCATAAILNEQVVSSDIASDDRWSAWRQRPLSQGFRAVWSTPILSANGKAIGTLALFHRQTKVPASDDQNMIAKFTHLASIAIERALNEGSLRRSEAFLAKTQRLSSSGSFSWRVSAGEITWSEQVYRIFGIEPGTEVTLDLIAAHHLPEDLPLVHDMIEKANAQQDFEYDHRLLMADGSVKYLHTVAHATYEANGEVEYIGAVHDVTARRLSEEALGAVRSELAHMSRVTSLGALTASIAHEVNQPLSGIVTNASTCVRMLSANPPNIDGAIETAKRTIRDGNRASDVIKRLRALFSKKSLKSESMDLNEATREVIALSRRELQRNRIILYTDFSDDLSIVTGDRVQLQQVILNLLLNAMESMSEVRDRPRQLVIKTENEEGGGVRLAVMDSGTGVDSTTLDKLFEPFHTTKSEGMGIGLSVSRSIIESHHGRIFAYNNEEHGTTFGFSIPPGISRSRELLQPEDDSSTAAEGHRPEPSVRIR
ncbi:PAS domain S-box-containing protein [Luteibacter sp. Sphag1AF]|uniref:PAS domain-containing protein n=1 Tax=Luteibacter sp. Sphag1AF TaxID=2587031 RepID=UPI001608D3D6|nr:PAS domain-containing protein [Luteibacter sp. Sphag1AF]MBB3228156.1 PAS domain S-box-containing protein [Luteibacter sp. Sphag1AF]